MTGKPGLSASSTAEGQLPSKDLERIIACEPELALWGMGVADEHVRWYSSTERPEQHAEERKQLCAYVREIEEIARWLKTFPTSSAFDRQFSSYTLKRVFQKDGGFYAPNGVFIAGGLAAGLRILSFPRYPNVYFNLRLPKRRYNEPDSIWSI